MTIHREFNTDVTLSYINIFLLSSISHFYIGLLVSYRSFVGFVHTALVFHATWICEVLLRLLSAIQLPIVNLFRYAARSIMADRMRTRIAGLAVEKPSTRRTNRPTMMTSVGDSRAPAHICIV